MKIKLEDKLSKEELNKLKELSKILRKIGIERKRIFKKYEGIDIKDVKQFYVD